MVVSALRDVRAMYDAGEAVMTMDVENAHNSIRRDSMWDAINRRADSLPFIRAFFRLAYSRSTRVYFQRRGSDFLLITSNVGARQGCGVASFCYNLSSGDALGDAVSRLPSGVRLLAIHDDLSATSRAVHHLTAFYVDACACLATIGLKVNARKCELLIPPGMRRPNPSDCVIPVIDGVYESIRVLGAHIGADAPSAAFVAGKWSETEHLVSLVAELGAEHPRAAVALLRFCCQPKLLYRFTVHSPHLCRAIAQQYDAKIFLALQSFIGQGIDRDLVVSGFGLRFIDYSASLETLHKRFRDNDIGSGSSKFDPCAEIRARHDATLLLRFPHLKARMTSMGAAAVGSASWCSPFASCGFEASSEDARLWFRYLLLADPRSADPCVCGTVDRFNGQFLQHMLTCDRITGANRTFPCHPLCPWYVRQGSCVADNGRQECPQQHQPLGHVVVNQQPQRQPPVCARFLPFGLRQNHDGLFPKEGKRLLGH
jgi:hypothetical protein